MNFARELVAELRADPALAAELRAMLGVQAVAQTEPAAIYLPAVAYARRVSLSERTIWNLIARGLPCIGQGRTRRVAVTDADAWLRARRDHVDDAVERQARAAARKVSRCLGK